MNESERDLPKSVEFTTESGWHYSLANINAIVGTRIIYSELYGWPPNTPTQRKLATLAIMQSALDLPTVGHLFKTEVITDDAEPLTNYSTFITDVVETIKEDSPSRLIKGELRKRVEAYRSG